MAEGVFNHLIKERGWEDRFQVDSSGTAAYHIGELADPRTLKTLKKHNVALDHRARKFVSEDFVDFDFIMAMDASNYSNIMRVHGATENGNKVWMMRAFEESAPNSNKSHLEVPDPYYGGDNGFDEVFEMLVRSQNNLLDYIAREQGWEG